MLRVAFMSVGIVPLLVQAQGTPSMEQMQSMFCNPDKMFAQMPPEVANNAEFKKMQEGMKKQMQCMCDFSKTGSFSALTQAMVSMKPPEKPSDVTWTAWNPMCEARFITDFMTMIKCQVEAMKSIATGTDASTKQMEQQVEQMAQSAQQGLKMFCNGIEQKGEKVEVKVSTVTMKLEGEIKAEAAALKKAMAEKLQIDEKMFEVPAPAAGRRLANTEVKAKNVVNGADKLATYMQSDAGQKAMQEASGNPALKVTEATASAAETMSALDLAKAASNKDGTLAQQEKTANSAAVLVPFAALSTALCA